MRFSQVVNHIYHQKRYESVSSFEVAELEKTHLNLLKNDNIEQTSHVSRFCKSLLESIPEVEKRTIKKTLYIFSDDIGDVIFEEYIKSDDYIKLVNRLVRPIRNAMKSVKNEFTGNISSHCQQQSVPTKLITLANMLLEGSTVTHFTNQNVLTCAQLLLYSFKPRTKYLRRPAENDEVKPNSETIYHSKMR